MNTFRVILADLVLDEDLWPRAGLNEERVQDFAELYASDGIDALPPIVVSDPYGDDKARSLTDGWHRVEAARRAGLTELLAVEYVAETDEAAYMEAVRLSAVSSLPMTRAEKRAAVDRLLCEQAGLSDRALAKIAGVSNTYVGSRRRALDGHEVSSAASVQRDEQEESVNNDTRSTAGLTPEQAADKLLRGMQQVLDGGLFLFNRDGNMAKVLSASAQHIYGDEAPKKLAELARWTARAKELCESAAP